MVDSGASETVIPEGLVRSVDVQASEASRRGVQYEVANGVQIPNLGQLTLNGFRDVEGFSRIVTTQVCDVKQPLMSVKRLRDSGHAVVFDSDGGRIEHMASGQSVRLSERDGMFMLKLWVPTKAGF